MKRIDPGIIALIVSLLIIGGGFAVGHLTSLIPAKDLWISFAIIVVFMGLAFGVGFLAVVPMLQKYIERSDLRAKKALKDIAQGLDLKLGAFEGRMDVFQVFQDPDWVITTKEMMELEEKVPQKEIWVISSYLTAETDDHRFAPIIRRNVEKGIIYNYVISDDPLSKDKISAISKMAGKGINCIRVMESDFFNLVSIHDTCVYDPFEVGDSAAVGYMNIPNDVNNLDYFVKLDPEYAKRLVSTIKSKGEPLVLDQG